MVAPGSRIFLKNVATERLKNCRWIKSCISWDGLDTAIGGIQVEIWGSTFMCAVTIERSLKPECTLYTDTIRHDMMTWKE